MILTEDDAVLIITLVSHYFHSENFIVAGNPTAEGLDEVKLLRRIAEEFPRLKSNVDLGLEGG